MRDNRIRMKIQNNEIKNYDTAINKYGSRD